MKTAISIPDEVFKQVEREAKRLGMSRSEFFTRAVRDFLGLSRNDAVTASYNQAFAEGDDEETRAFRKRAARQSLLGIEWDDK